MFSIQLEAKLQNMCKKYSLFVLKENISNISILEHGIA